MLIIIMYILQYIGEWCNGRREGTGELIFQNYKYKGNFVDDQVIIICIIIIIIIIILYSQPQGAGKYTFDIGVQQLGDYILEKIVSYIIIISKSNKLYIYNYNNL